jgi:hypothetical protein
MADMNSFFQSIGQCIASNNGNELAKIIALPIGKKPMTRIYQQIAQRCKTINILSYCNSNIHQDENISSVVGNMLSALVCITEEKWKEAYDFELNAYNSILAYFKDSTTDWSTPVIVTISNDLRSLAEQVCAISDIVRIPLTPYTCCLILLG